MSRRDRWLREADCSTSGFVEHDLPFSIQTSKLTADVVAKSLAMVRGDAILYKALRNGFDAYFATGQLIPQTLPKWQSGHAFPWSESYYELLCSQQLCLAGYYRHSLFALRSVLELGTLGVFYDLDDKAEENVKTWLRSDTPTPWFKLCVRRLCEVGHFYEYDASLGLRSSIEQCYDRLSNYVHSRGFRHSSSGLAGRHAYFNAFREKSLMAYVAHARDVVEAVITLMLLKYPIGMQALPLDEKFGLNPPAGGFFDIGNKTVVNRVLDDQVVASLQSISDADREVKSIVDAFNSMPDITEEEFRRQVEDFDRRFPTKVVASQGNE